MITIGSDPEFGLLNERGSQAMAFDYLPSSTSAPIGLDGHSHIGELRPEYSLTPRDHVMNIARLMAELDPLIPPEIRVTAGSMVTNDAIGGHIHFGNLGRGFDTSLATKALDYFLALPVALLEVTRSARTRRISTGYGALSSYRRQEWGFEYRTLPSWLVSWGVALSVLSVGYAVVDAIKQKSCPKIPGGVPHANDFKQCNKKAMKSFLPGIKQGWREMPLYSEFRLETAFLNHLLIHELEFREKQDIRDKWLNRGKKKYASGFRVIGSPNDENCAEIARLVEESQRDLRVLIYGLNPRREPSIALSHGTSISSLPRLPIEFERFGVAANAQYDDWLCIGLSHPLRQDVEEAASIVNGILREGVAMEPPRPTRRGTTTGGHWRNQPRDRFGRWITGTREGGLPF